MKKTGSPPRKLALVMSGGVAVLFLSACTSLAASEALKLPPLTTASGNARIAGKFVWADLVTDDVAAVRGFYSTLFGWTFQDLGNYAIASKDQRPLCGLFQRPRPTGRDDAKPRWFGFISVPNVERAQAAVIKGGGRVLAAAHKMPARGEQALFADPEGAIFGVVKSSSGDPEDFLADPGEWIWVELLSKDARTACDFYRSVAGYQVVENEESSRPGDFILLASGYARGAALTLPSDKRQVSSKWLFFLRVASVRECAGLAEKCGGKILLQPKPELLDGRVAVLADPTGAEIGIMEWSEKSLKQKN